MEESGSGEQSKKRGKLENESSYWDLLPFEVWNLIVEFIAFPFPRVNLRVVSKTFNDLVNKLSHAVEISIRGSVKCTKSLILRTSHDASNHFCRTAYVLIKHQRNYSHHRLQIRCY